MPLWGKKSGTFLEEKKPTWQKDRDPTGSKDRPESNEEQNTFAANTGWVRRVNKAGRTIEEVLVAMSSKTDGTNDLATVLGGANTTSIRFANSSSMTPGDPLVVSVGFNENVYVVGAPTIKVANSSGALVTLTRESSSGANGTSRVEFTATSGKAITGNGVFGILENATPAGTSEITLGSGNIFDAAAYDTNKTIITVAGLEFAHITVAGAPYKTDNFGANVSITGPVPGIP